MFAKLPSLNALRAFEAFSRHLSYTEAARELNVTPAAVKQLVSKLEDYLETPLIRRAGQKLELTEAGHSGVGAFSSGLHQLSKGVASIQESTARRRLVVSVEPFFAATWLVPRLNKFKSRHPDIDVLINSDIAISQLERGEADIAVRYGVKPDPSFVSVRLFDDQVFPVCSPALVSALRDIRDLNNATLLHWDLSQMPWASTSAHWFSFSEWFKLAGERDLTASQNLYFSDYNLVLQAAIAGQGVMLGSWPIMRDMVDNNLLAIPFSTTVATDIGYDLVATPQSLEVSYVSDFRAWLLEEASNQPKYRFSGT